MILHVLPGDAIVENFKAAGIDGEIAVCRETLVEGDVSGNTLPEFWENRARFLSPEFPDTENDYHETVVREFAKLTALQSGSEINLWFEYELFCNVNMWFCLSLVSGSTADIFRVAPVVVSEADIWNGFGRVPPDGLKKCYAARIPLSPDDIILGGDLWQAYRKADHAELERLSMSQSPAFPRLREVCQAEIAKQSRPLEIVAQIIRDGKTEFSDVFREFKTRAGVYGFGDTQVKRIYQKLLV